MITLLLGVSPIITPLKTAVANANFHQLGSPLKTQPFHFCLYQKKCYEFLCFPGSPQTNNGSKKGSISISCQATVRFAVGQGDRSGSSDGRKVDSKEVELLDLELCNLPGWCPARDTSQGTVRPPNGPRDVG